MTIPLRLLKACLFSVCGLVTVTVSGNDTLPLPQVLHLGIEQGLPNRVVYGSVYDRFGLLWLTTESGLCRYDGYHVNHLTDFPQRFRGDLWRGPDDRLMAIPSGYPDSLEIFDPRTLRVSGIDFSTRVAGNHAGIARNAEQEIYFAAGGFIYTYDPETDRLDQVHQLRVEIRAGDRLLHATEEDYLLYRADRRAFFSAAGHYIDLPEDMEPKLLHRDVSGNLWAGDDQRLRWLPAGANSFQDGPASPTGEVFNYLREDHVGNLLLGYLRPAFFRLSSLVMRTHTGQIEDLSWLTEKENRILNLGGENFTEEIRGNTHAGLWIFRSRRPRPAIFRNYLEKELAPNGFGHVMRGFTADTLGNVYVNKDSKDPWWFRVRGTDGRLDTLVMRDEKGNIANQFGCGTELIQYQGDIYGMSCYWGDIDTGHVYRYQPTTDRWFRWALPQINQIPRWIIEGRTPDELLLFCQDRKQASNGNIYAFYPRRDSFSLVQTTGPEYNLRGWVKAVTKDTTRHAYWLASEAGLYRYDYLTDQLTRHLFPDGSSTRISDVVLLGDGKLLLGTFGNGLQIFDPEETTFLHVGGHLRAGNAPPNTDHFLPLPSDYIAGIDHTPDSAMLITTFNGLVYHGHGPTAYFSEADGLPNNEFNTPSLFRNPKDGRWYAGGVNGFTSFTTADLSAPASPFIPSMLRYRLLDETVGQQTVHLLPSAPEEPLVIHPSVAYFILEYTIPDYFQRTKRRYQTRLVGYDPDWLAPTQEPRIRYTRLPPGDYVFQLRAIDGTNRTSPVIRETRITVLKPWYLRWWFITLCVLLGSLLLYLRFSSYVKRLAREYESAQRLQESELRILRQQLNPHFLSNAMVAIKDYAERASPQEVGAYLMDFNRLMRLFMESSRKRFISVGDEVEMLQRYVRLEQLRFPGKFTAVFEVDPAIDPGMDELPSLLLQPIVENAINHGLRNLPGSGELLIRIELEDEEKEIITCTVADDGIGRRRAVAASRVRPDHVSRATDILEDRLNLLKNDASLDIEIKTQDLRPGQEYPGTVVYIRISGEGE